MPHLVRLRPGVDRNQVLANLRDARNALYNIQGGDFHQQRLAYQRWAHNAARMINNQISAEDIDRLILTRRYWLLQTLPANGDDDARVLKSTSAVAALWTADSRTANF